MDISDFDEEEEYVIHVDCNLGYASSLEPELDIPSIHASQPSMFHHRLPFYWILLY